MLPKITTLGFIALVLAGKWGDLPHPDTQVLQGTWEIVAVERSGVNDPSPVGFTLQFVGNEAHFQVPLDQPWVPISSYISDVTPLSAEKLDRMALS
jgi:hypothetical protein